MSILQKMYTAKIWRKPRRGFSVAVCLLMVCGGCATVSKPPVIVNEFQHDKSYDVVWAAVIEALADLKIPVVEMSKASGTITTGWAVIPDEYCDCGSAPIFRVVNHNIQFNILVKRHESGVAVQVNSIVRASRFITGKGQVPTLSIDCNSTGVAEQRINQEVAKKLH